MLKNFIAALITPTIEDRPVVNTSTHPARTAVQGIVIAEILGGTLAEKAVYTAYPFAISAAATAGAYRVKDEFKN
jgi:hypothetical protein